ncbi:MAG: hypothetical protein AAF633_15865, partial [Chloroflexota bacterium]
MRKSKRFNRFNHLWRTTPLSKKDRARRRRLKSSAAFLAIIGIILLFAFPSITKAIPLTDQDKFDRIWRIARDVGAYEFETDLLETTLPAFGVENIGQTPQYSQATALGSANAAEDLVTFEVDTSQGAFELRIKEGIAYARPSLDDDAPWVVMEGAPSLFAPGNDAMGFAAAASDVVMVENWRSVETLDALTQIKVADAAEMFTFAVDGKKLAEIIRDQQEAELAKKGALAPGQEVGLSPEYTQFTGTGRLWIDANGLPLYQVLELDMPSQDGAGSQVEIEMFTSYRGWEEGKSTTSAWGMIQRVYADPGILASDPVSLVPNAHTLTPQLLQASGMMIGLIILVAGIGLIIFYMIINSRSRTIHAATSAIMISLMVFTPFMQVGSLLAYEGRFEAAYSASESNPFTSASEPTAEEQLMERMSREKEEQFNPLIDPLADQTDTGLQEIDNELSADGEDGLLQSSLKADASVEIETSVEASVESQIEAAPAAITLQATCVISDTEADCDGDGLSNGTEALRLGTDPESVDTDGDLISDGTEAAGFEIDGQTWYLNPNNADTNQDEILDTFECPSLIDIDEDGLLITNPDPPLEACGDTDDDGVPDVYDFDNDGDGVHDFVDNSPSYKADISTENQDYVGLTIDNFDADESILVEYQIRPSDPALLWHNGTTIPWGRDTEGQVTKV